MSIALKGESNDIIPSSDKMRFADSTLSAALIQHRISPEERAHGPGVRHITREERQRKGLPDDVTHKLKFMLDGQ